MMRLRPLPATAALAWAATVLIVNGTPADQLPRAGLWLLRFPHADKVVHAGMYGVMAALAWWAVSTSKPRPAWLMAAIAAGVAAVGAADEVHQSMVPGRSMDPMDWLADAAGAVAAVVALRWWEQWRAQDRAPGVSCTP